MAGGIHKGNSEGLLKNYVERIVEGIPNILLEFSNKWPTEFPEKLKKNENKLPKILLTKSTKKFELIRSQIFQRNC